jgi:hypothetical protein
VKELGLSGVCEIAWFRQLWGQRSARRTRRRFFISGALARLNSSEGWAKCDQLGQLLRCGITNQAVVAHFHNRDGSDPFRQQHLWLESYVKCFQGKTHLLLQGLEPGENDGTLLSGGFQLAVAVSASVIGG